MKNHILTKGILIFQLGFVCVTSVSLASCMSPDYIPDAHTESKLSLTQAAAQTGQNAEDATIRWALNGCILCDDDVDAGDVDTETISTSRVSSDGKYLIFETIGTTPETKHKCDIPINVIASFGLRYGSSQTVIDDRNSRSLKCGAAEVLTISWDSREEAIAFINAIAMLSAAPPGAYATAKDADEASFKTIAESYRNAINKPPLPPQTEMYSAQANDAFANHQTSRAIQLYYQILGDSPWWPTGRYNLALLLADQQDYDDAIDEMKKYLELVPDAPDAQKAQQQIWVWQGREQSNQ